MKTLSKDLLIDSLRQGGQATYLFFWGHKQSGTGITKSCLSQWYPAAFVVDGLKYKTAEHFMMAEKARLFGDRISEQQILSAETPDRAKALGRKVTGFSSEIWEIHRSEIVRKGNLHKFSQRSELGRFLLSTGNQVLVEASPVDSIWGIGLAAEDARANDPSLWQGENLLGFALMQVRDQLINLSQ